MMWTRGTFKNVVDFEQRRRERDDEQRVSEVLYSTPRERVSNVVPLWPRDPEPPRAA